MAKKLSIPSVATTDTAGIPLSTKIFLQAVETGLATLDNNVVYKDGITVPTPTSGLRAISAQGQGFTISSVSVASGEDHATLVSDVKALLQSHLQLQQTVSSLIEQLQGV